MAVEILTAFGGKILELLVKPIGRQFSYALRRRKYLDDLNREVVRLGDKRNEVQQRIEADLMRYRAVIQPSVKDWTQEVDTFLDQAKEFLNRSHADVESKCFNRWSPNFIARRRMGKESEKKKKEAEKLYNRSNFGNVTNHAPPMRRGYIFSGNNMKCYKATEQAMENVMEALRNEKINFIGIHGMGGVGKTTLVKEISIKVEEERLFDVVVMVVVSQNPDIKKLQDDMASELDLEKLKDGGEDRRAAELREKFEEKGSALVILDDVWSILQLKKLGIPFDEDHPGCRIIITTRREAVCSSMAMKRDRTTIVHLDVLSPEDSWCLFRDTVGSTADRPMIKEAAKLVCMECGCLPLALVTVGSAMKGKNELEEWKSAAHELKYSEPMNIEGVEEQVYRSIKLSYDYLNDDKSREFFLLCSLFPEDENIEIESLVRYGIGLRMFGIFDTIKKERDTATSVINNLKSSNLLLEGYDKKSQIKMHDIIRDVAKSIGSNKYFVQAGCGLEAWPNMDFMDIQHVGISLMKNNIDGHPESLQSTRLQILLLNELNPLFSDKFFSGLKALKVLDLGYDNARGDIRKQPNLGFLCGLTCLHTLVLDGYEFEDMTGLGQIQTLKVLSLRGSTIKTVLDERGKLTNLRLLDMSETTLSFPITTDVASAWSCLEELHLIESECDPFDTQKLPIDVAALRSLKRLKALSMSICVTRPTNLDFDLPDEVRFSIYIGFLEQKWVGNREDDIFQENISENILVLEGCQEHELHSVEWLRMLLKRSKYLSLRNIEEMGSWPPAASLEVLCNLRFLTLTDCKSLKYLFQPSTAQALQQLERLVVIDCDELVEVVAEQNQGQEEEEGNIVLFQSLKEIRLVILPNLSCFCSAENFSFEWPSLQKLIVFMCPRMRYFAPTTSRIQSTPNLIVLSLDGSPTTIQITELDQVLEDHFKSKEVATGEIVEDDAAID